MFLHFGRSLKSELSSFLILQLRQGRLQENARLRGVNQGLGDARQKAQVIISTERVTDRATDKIREQKS